jgi:hypothetical protein
MEGERGGAMADVGISSQNEKTSNLCGKTSGTERNDEAGAIE